MNQMVSDIGGIYKIRMKQLQEQFKQAVERIEDETKNLESLKLKKKKLRNKMIDIFQFLLKNPSIIMYSALTVDR